jgi:predicted RNase H-related nuclease YkuK (DUF458 family)
MRQFKTLDKVPITDVVQYIKDYLRKFKTVEILIGCDSQCYGTYKTVYGVVIVLYEPGKGGHVLCTKDVEKYEGNTPVRLLTEVWKGIEVAEFLKEQGLPAPKWFDIDLNPDSKYNSNSVLRQAIGMVEGMGYHARCKHHGVMATYAANALVRQGSRKSRDRKSKVV